MRLAGDLGGFRAKLGDGLQHGASLTSGCQASNNSFKTPGRPEALVPSDQANDPTQLPQSILPCGAIAPRHARRHRKSGHFVWPQWPPAMVAVGQDPFMGKVKC